MTFKFNLSVILFCQFIPALALEWIGLIILGEYNLIGVA